MRPVDQAGSIAQVDGQIQRGITIGTLFVGDQEDLFDDVSIFKISYKPAETWRAVRGESKGEGGDSRRGELCARQANRITKPQMRPTIARPETKTSLRVTSQKAGYVKIGAGDQFDRE